MPIKTQEDRLNRRAVMLGIRALEEIQHCRANDYTVVAVRLSGET